MAWDASVPALLIGRGTVGHLPVPILVLGSRPVVELAVLVLERGLEPAVRSRTPRAELALDELGRGT